MQPTTGKIKIFKKHHTTSEVTQVEGSYEIRLHHPVIGGEWTVFQLQGGATGYEGFTLIDNRGPHISTINSVLNSPYWSACAGRFELIDEVRVHKSEMRRILVPWIESANLVGACSMCPSPEGMLAEDPHLLKVADRLDYRFLCCDCHSQKDKETQSVATG